MYRSESDHLSNDNNSDLESLSFLKGQGFLGGGSLYNLAVDENELNFFGVMFSFNVGPFAAIPARKTKYSAHLRVGMHK